jgi:hypothetical protein
MPKQEDENEEEAVMARVFVCVVSAFVCADDQNRIAEHVFGVSEEPEY